MEDRIKYFSLFSGIGGFELGIGDKAECVGYSEVDKYAIKIYESHFKHKNYGDIKKIDARELPDFDLIVGGFPCQAFSIAGKRQGFYDARGNLFFEIARIIREKQPRLLLLENVKGLLSHDQGRTFGVIIRTLDELGYDLQWQVLNSKDFGVPQNRERVLIVGHLRGTSRPEVFPITGSNPKSIKQLIGGSQGNRLYDTDGVSVTLASQAGGQGAKTGLYAVTRGRSDDQWKKSGISPTRRGGDKDDIKVVVPVLTPDRPIKRQNGRRMKEDGEPSFTLTAQDRHGIFDGVKIRRLTPVECARLQGFPDDWHKVEGISDTQAYKCYGNAVTVNVVKSIIQRLITEKQ